LSLLIDLFGYLSVILHGLTIIAQSMTIGGVLFLVLLARPLRAQLGPPGNAILRRTAQVTALCACTLVICEALTIALEAAVLVGTVDLSVGTALGANFARAGFVKISASLLVAVLLLRRRAEAPPAALLTLGLVELASATLTTHAAARIEGSGPLLVAEGLHQFGAAIWIGGIPYFLLALAAVRDGASVRRIGARFSRMSMAGVGAILVSGLVMSVAYIGSWQAFYGTAYGVMVAAKIALFLMLLGLGGMNFLLVERLRTHPATPVTRLKRFAEVEIGIGFTIFLAAASLTSVPPARDLTTDRVSWHEIVERNWPLWPRLTSPDHDVLALPALQHRLDAEHANRSSSTPPAFIPGSGELPPRNAADIAWSEYNHHWAGLFVLAIGLLALLNQAGFSPARHWPLLFFGLAGFLFFRSDPETWPLGSIGFFESFRDVEVLQHRVFVLLVVVFAAFEWRVRAKRLQNGRLALVFPLMCAGGGALLLTHNHALANIKDQLLIELTHTPLAITAVAAGWSRWLELRTNPPLSRIAGWFWPVALVLIGLLLVNYREA
jgi:copper resistance protein D